MASLIPGFEYDIFISYRQNDNRVVGENVGWVAEFVHNLRVELESVLKEKLEIYFDQNPVDGLSETHDVDESLTPKLKSIIFIPIVSQTYCDTKSFAWQKEFQSFLGMISKDDFGPMIKLPTGNFQHRVLPIRIHDINDNDKSLLESSLNAKLRPIDFIYKSHGVNRPLSSKEDNPTKNQNHLIYRDQINKTANAVRDIIQTLLHTGRPLSDQTSNIKIQLETAPIHQRPTSHSMVVLNFETNDESAHLLSEGISIELGRMLNSIKGAKVLIKNNKLSEGAEKFMDTLGASSIVTGKVVIKKDQVEIRIQLRSVKDSKVLWEEQGDSHDVHKFLCNSAIAIAGTLHIKLTEQDNILIQKAYSENVNAYRAYLEGQSYKYQHGDGLIGALSKFQQAIDMDASFAMAHARIANIYILLGYYDLMPFDSAFVKAKLASLKSLELDKTLVQGYESLALICMCYEWNWPDLENDFARIFSIIPAGEKAKEKFHVFHERIVNTLTELENEPIVSIPFFLPAYALIHQGNFESAFDISTKAVDKDPDSFMAHRALGLSCVGLEKYEKAIHALETAATLSNRLKPILFELTGAYLQAGEIEKAKSLLEEVMIDSNVVMARIYNVFFQFP